jgi:alpha-beta hydrolase superfamily lysophospholipase
MKCSAIILSLLLLLLLLVALLGQFRPRHASPGDVQVDIRQGTRPGTLYLMVDGLRMPLLSGEKRWNEIASLLLKSGDVAMVQYDAMPWSNASAKLVAQEISHQMQSKRDPTRHSNVVVIGNSMGALLARRAILHSLSAPGREVSPTEPVAWASEVKRVVLLAGMNRGWDISGEKPADMRWPTHAAISIGSWFARLSGSGSLMMDMEAGSPFVAELRMDWMSRVNTPGHNLKTVQLLGDIDELVSSEDNQDLNVTGYDDFAWIKVRGTGHADITDFDENERDFNLGEYRRDKFLSAADLDIPFSTLKRESEVPPASKDPDVTRVVFVMHGIRDLGRWSSSFETELQRRHAASRACGKLAVASIRYGYFGMGQFLLRKDREKYVRWFMDQYTETLARYPNLKEIHFVGHSNGTYLLAKALERYPSMKIDKVVLAGSVIRTDYDWRNRFERQQVKAVRNYVAQDDWVVALFPRFFEQRMASWMNDDIGSAGFNGFDEDSSKGLEVENLGYIRGAHGAFQGYVQAIADYLIPGTGLPVPDGQAVGPVKDSKRGWCALKFFSDRFTLALWLSLAFVIIWLGAKVANAAGSQSLVALVAYVLLVMQVLRWA